LVDIERLTDSERDFYWSGTSDSGSGYLVVRVPPDYIAFIGRLAERAGPVSATGIQSRFRTGRLPVALELKESDHRTNLFLNTPGGIGVLTIWEFGADGAKIFRLVPFLNVRVGDSKGTLALASSNSESMALWKLTWVEENSRVQFELCIPDRLSNFNLPTMSASQVLDLAADIGSAELK
jgi:hypothetical protein